MLRTDRGGEFTSNEFTKYCKENGIARQLTAPYSPQQNGVVKRRNRTVLSTTRSIMKAMKLPLTFWVEAVRHAIYIINRVPTRALEDKTPYEALYSRKPNLENLRIFGCTTYAKITIPHLKKLDDRSIPMIYLGVDEGSKACRLYDPIAKKKHNAREVETKTLLFTEEEPRNYKEASIDRKWIEAMEIELDSINKNNTWTLTTLPINQKAIGLKWVYKAKRDAKGNIIKYKAQLVAKGYVQEQGIDFDEVFEPVARIEIVRLILALAAYHGWQVHHLDVKSAFLHGDLKEEVYVTQLEGFIQQENSEKVYKLTKALYGLRQAPRAWNIKLDQTLKSLDFKKCNLEQAVYIKRSKTSTLIVGVYVDDLIITGTPRKELEVFKSQMEDKFKMSDLGLLAYYLGIEVTQTGGEITIKQTGYINKILKETSMMDSNDTKIPMDPGTKLVKAKDGNSVDATHYRSLIGIHRYLLHTRPDLTCQALWLKRLLSKLTGREEERITLKVDNISAIALIRNPVFHGRSKHIDIRYHFIHECVENGHINVEHVSGELQRTDILTKALPRLRFYIIEPNDSVSINTIIESRDVISDENSFSLIPRPKDVISNLDESQRDDHSNDVPMNLIKEDVRTYNEVIQSRDVAFRKEAIDDEIGSIMENNTWVLSDLPPRMQNFRQKEGIDYFDTYAPVAHITAIRLLIALAAIHNLVIHRMNVKTTFLIVDLEEEVYMKQPKGFVMPGNEHKMCKLIKSLYWLKQAPKQWHQKFNEVVLYNGFILNQSGKCVYKKFDESSKGAIICLYVDDMLIFGTDQNQVDKTKKFFSSKFSIKDIGEANVILEEKLMPNTSKHVAQLEYSKSISCLMYAMMSTRPDIAYVVGRLSMFTSNPSRHH
nr:ribonuclease H-like domain, reverse transcriptase, RNA-dependent DNA polymerase [Tanacetum cinerariifolium]